MKLFKTAAITSLLLVFVWSCKKDYTIGGTLFKAQVDMTTYDYLKTNHLFDTLVIMIDAAGLKDELNQAGTFFAVTNYTIRNYVDSRAAVAKLAANNENLIYTFDSLDLPALKDSLRSYMFHDRITRDNISQIGKLATANDGEVRLIQLLPSTDYTNANVFTTDPKYIYLTKMIPLPGSPIPTDSTGISQLLPQQLLPTLCQTTGILTKTGVLHVLNNQHIFDFYRYQQ
jgi:hypothetical protein